MTDTEKKAANEERIGEMSFEAAAAELSGIVEKLNSGSTQLDEMIALYEKGVTLSDHCMKLLKEYDGRIEKAVRRAAPGTNE